MNSQEIASRDSLRKFTKEELIDYILAVSFMLKQHPPARTILEFKVEKIHKKIDQNLQKTDELINAARNKQIASGEFSERHFKLSSFDLEKVRKEILIKKINKALSEFEKKPTIYWTQTPMEKPLWEDLKAYVEKQIPKQPLFDNNEEWLECPVCGEVIPEYTAENETKCFCVGCGQKLSWGE